MLRVMNTLISVFNTHEKPFRYLLAQLLVKAGLNKRKIIHRSNGYKIHFSDAAVARILYAYKDERIEEEALLTRILQPGNVYVDVGANIGTLALTASLAVGENGNVIAIEAHPLTFKYLESNIKLNGFSNIELIHSAVGDSEGELIFSDQNSDDQNRILIDRETGIRVPVETLDKILKGEMEIHLLKIDVEGYEKFVLDGAEETLKRTTAVLFESWDDHFAYYGYDFKTIFDYLNGCGFRVFKLEGEILQRVNSDYRSLNCENLLALRFPDQFVEKFGFEMR